MLWILLGLIDTLSYCVQSEINKHYKIDGFRLSALRSLFAFLLMLPLLPWMAWPNSAAFYGVIGMGAIISVFGMAIQYNLAAKKSGRVASLNQPIEIILTFTVWLMLDETQRQFLIDNPGNTAVILAGMMLFFVSLRAIRKNAAGWDAFAAIFPVAVMYSCLSIATRLILQDGTALLSSSLTYVFLCNGIMFLIALPIYIKRFKEDCVPDKNTLVGISGVAFFQTLCWVSYLLALVWAPNPAYLVVINSLSAPLFVLYYKLRKFHDDASPVAGVFMAVAAMAIILAGK